MERVELKFSNLRNGVPFVLKDSLLNPLMSLVNKWVMIQEKHWVALVNSKPVKMEIKISVLKTDLKLKPLMLNVPIKKSWANVEDKKLPNAQLK